MKKLKEKVLGKNKYIHIKNEEQLKEISQVIVIANSHANTFHEMYRYYDGNFNYPCYINIRKTYEWSYFEDDDIEADAIFEDIKMIEYHKAFEKCLTLEEALVLNIELSKSVEQEEYGKVLIKEIFGRI